MTVNLARVATAAQASAQAFRLYSRTSGQQRAALLRAIATGIEGLGDRLVDCVTRETALPRARVLNERARTCMQLRLFADLAEAGAWVDERVDAADMARQPPKPQVRSLLRPIGPVGVFGASNFPLAFSVAGGDTAAALAVGCTVIVKAHPAHPETSRHVGDAIHAAVAECGLPAGVFDLLFDDGDHSIGIALLEQPQIKAGAFTGSQRAGLALLRVAQSRPEPIPFFAEMGSVNPVFILPRALAAGGSEIANGLHASMVLGVGQFCTQPGLIFIVDDVAGRGFLQTLAERVNGTEPGTMLTPGMSRDYRRLVAERSALTAVQTCARVSCADEALVGAALFAVDAAAFQATPSLHEELFGPASLVVRCKDVAEIVRCVDALSGQLTATVWCEPADLPEQADLLWTLEQKAGRIVFNGFPTGVEVGTAMMHGGPFPATNDSRFTSVGTRAIARFVRPVAYQNEF